MKPILLFLLLTTLGLQAQTNETMAPPYEEIPAYPENFGPGSILSRMIDGLGYRYYWSTEGLKEGDYGYKPSEDARSIRETMVHICSLSQTTLHAVKNENIVFTYDFDALSNGELRTKTLENLREASKEMLGKSDEALAVFTMKFKQGDKVNEAPFWHLINGPIADAIYHTGQIVSFRRSNGNPMHSGVSVFSGKTKKVE